KDFRVYSAALADAQVAALANELAPGNLAEMLASVTLPDTSALTENITLPSFPGLTWTSSDPSVITDTGRVYRPAPDQPDGTATLTATVTHRGLTESKDFEVTVLKRVAFSEEELNEGLVHHFRLDETEGTVLANTGSAGSAANAELVNPDKATLTGEGVRFNPDSYEDSLEGGYVRLPNNLTAGMTSLTVDYEVWVDPANVGTTRCGASAARPARATPTRASRARSTPRTPPHVPVSGSGSPSATRTSCRTAAACSR